MLDLLAIALLVLGVLSILTGLILLARTRPAAPPAGRRRRTAATLGGPPLPPPQPRPLPPLADVVDLAERRAARRILAGLEVRRHPGA